MLALPLLCPQELCPFMVSVFQLASGGDGRLSPTHSTTRQVSSFMLTDTSANGVCTILLPTQGAGPVLLGVAVSGTQRQLSHPALTNSVPNSVPALPPTIGIQWRGAWSGHCSPTHAVTGQSSNGDRSPMVITLKLAHPPRHQQERLSCDAQMRNVACSRTWQLVAGSGSSPTF